MQRQSAHIRTVFFRRAACSAIRTLYDDRTSLLVDLIKKLQHLVLYCLHIEARIIKIRLFSPWSPRISHFLLGRAPPGDANPELCTTLQRARGDDNLMRIGSLFRRPDITYIFTQSDNKIMVIATRRGFFSYRIVCGVSKTSIRSANANGVASSP